MANNNKHTGPNVPALRFPEFSGEWEKMSLQDCCSDFSYGLNAPAKAYDGVNKYIRITDIDENTSVYKSDDPVSPDGLLSDEYLVNENDILFARTGASTGKTYLYNQNDGRLFYAGFLIKANVNNNCDPYFIFSQTKTQSYRRWVEIMSTRSGQPAINSQEYASYPLYVPSKEEQEKIALLLRDLDKRILVQSKIIEEQETLLKSLRESLLKQCSKSSVSCKIGDILTIRSGKDYQHLENGDIPVYGTGGLMCHVNNFLHDGESVCIGRKGTINKPLYLNGKFWTVDTLFYTHSFKGVLPRYCYHLFCTIDWLTYNEASGVPSLSKSTIEKISVVIPSIKIQESTVQALDSVEQKIDIDRNVLLGYQQQKEYLLSRMFI